MNPFRAAQRTIILFRLLLLTAIFLNSLVALLLIQGAPRADQVPAQTPVAGLPRTPGPGPREVEGRFRGINVPVWGPDFVVATPSINRAPRLGANWVSLVSHWYVSTAAPYTGGGIYREQGTAGAGANRTVSDESLGSAIDDAHAAGLAVMLKPHVDWIDGGWRGYFYFADDGARQDWWAGYREMISSTVELAIRHEAEAICIGTEFGDINKEPGSAAQWIGIIQQIRAAGYDGLLTYAANWGPYGDAEYNRPGLQGVWDRLDFVGIDAYFPLSLDKDPTLEQFISGWTDSVNPWDPTYRQNNVKQLEYLANRTGKQVVFTEIGYPATDYAGKNPGAGGEGLENDEAQARAAEAVFAVWNSVEWWGGMFWWQDGPVFNALSIAGRPAEGVLREHWLDDNEALRNGDKVLGSD